MINTVTTGSIFMDLIDKFKIVSEIALISIFLAWRPIDE
jgi:hypothetical protein